MARTDPQMIIRMPAELKAWIIAKATQNRRSQNGEIVARLEESHRRELSTQQQASA